MLAAVVLAACSGPSGDNDGGVGSDGAARDGSSTTTDGSVGAEVSFDELCQVITSDICRSLMDCHGWDYADLDHCIADQECTGFGADRTSQWGNQCPRDGRASIQSRRRGA